MTPTESKAPPDGAEHGPEARRLASVCRWARARWKPLVISGSVLLVSAFILWLYAFLRPDTWRYYTDETTFRQLARDTEPRLVLWEDARLVDGGPGPQQDAYESTISADGSRMVFTRGLGGGNADLYLSVWDGHSWGPQGPLRALNSPFNEISPALSKDGRFLFFSTDRPGGRGGFDVWVARWDGAEFAWPLPLTLMVNSPFDELGPEPSSTGNRLYFTSNRPHRALTDEEEALSGPELRDRFADRDHDIFAADRIPEGITNRAVERAQSMLYYLREGALADEAVMTKLGGTRSSENTVDRALTWLARNQETNGNWSITRHGGQAGHDMAATAFALLTFFGRGERHDRASEYQGTVSNGVQWLVSYQNQLTGDLRGKRPPGNGMYDHSIASLALAEAYGLSKDENLFMAAQSAIDFLVDAQNPEDGGWRYRPRDRGDLSVSGWAIMALKSAELSGLHVPQRTYDGVRKWLKQVSGGKHSGIYGYQSGGSGSAAMIATGWFCSQLMGLSPNTFRSFETSDRLGKTGVSSTDLYYAYYGTLSVYQNQGPLWRRWSRQLQKLFIDSQQPDGSWVATDGHGRSMGRVITTSLAALSLQAHYRYTPLYGLGYEPDPGRKRIATLHADNVAEVPLYRRAKLLSDLSSPRHDVQPFATHHGDYLYFVSDRQGGHGRLDIYRSRISNEEPGVPENLGAAGNSRYDDTDPSLRMAGFELVFGSRRKTDGAEVWNLHASTSRQVYRRHVRGALPAMNWMFQRFRWRFILLAVSFAGFALSIGLFARPRRRKAEEGDQPE